MSVFGPGVGGGMLALAGGLQGAGQGIQMAAGEQMKMNYAAKMNELAQAREEAITRLQGSQAKDLQAQRAGTEKDLQQGNIAAQQGMEQTREGFETKQTERKIGAASAAAGATRQFEGEQNKAKLTSEEKRTGITANSRVDAALVRASASANSGNKGKTWSLHNVKTSGFDPTSKLPTESDMPVLVNEKTGRQKLQIGDKFIDYDASKNGPAYDPASLARAPAADMNDLNNDPLGKVPSGKNAGMSKVDAFEQTFHYIPAQWAAAAQAAEQQQHASSASMSLPSGLVRRLGGPSATSAKIGSFGGGGADEDGGDENAAQSEEDSSSNSPAFQSNAMNSYGNVAQ